MGDGGNWTHREAKPSADALPPHWDDAQWLRGVLGAIPAFVLRLEGEQSIVYVNRLQPGFELEGVIGHSTYEYVAPEYHELHREAIGRLRRTKQPQRYIVRGSGPDGTQVYYETNLTLVSDGTGDIVLFAVDVTEHVERAEALRESEEQLRLAVQATGLGLWSWNRQTGEVMWNDRMYEITGRVEPVSPRDWISLIVAPEDADRVAEELGAAGSQRLSHRIVRPDGEVRWVLLIGGDAGSDEALLRGGVLDVTRQSELEERLRAAQRRESIGTLTAGVAHNFNNMLAVIQPSIELALRTAEGQAKSALSDALYAAQRAAQLVSGLMTYAGQRTTAHKVRATAPDLITNALRMCRQTFDRQLRLSVSVDGDPGMVRGDVSDLEQLLLNLLINARDAVADSTDPQISIEIDEVEASDPGAESAAVGPYVRIRVTDNGVGMGKETLSRVFEPFFTQKEPGLGTGLGLATSYAIAREHGGWIEFRSEQGAGTRASVLLPVAESSAEESASQRAAPATERARILVVEDEAAVRNIVCSVLSELGHTVVSAQDATRAAEVLDAGDTPDVVLLDRSMPGWPARRAVAEIRRRASGARILFFTGQNVPPAELELVDGVVYKPVSIGELETAILDCLARPSEPRGKG